MSLSDEEESIAESLSEELTVSSHPYERSEDAKGAVTSNSGLDDAYSEDFAKTSASTVVSVSHAASVEEHVDDEDDEDEDFEDDFEDDIEDNVNENDVEEEASKRTRADSPVGTGTRAQRTAEPQDVSVAYTTEFEEEPSMASAAFPEARKSANADVLRADLILAQRELARLRGRDVQMLVNKQARASKRREEHEAALERAVGDAERCREQVEIFRTRAAEAQNGQLCAENESTVQRTTIARLEAEAKILRANLEAANARAESLAQDRLRAECDIQERLKRATLVHEAELEAAQQALATYRQEVEESRDKFETTALERARAHESRVDRMQAALEAEMAILQRERDSLRRAQHEVHSKLDAQLQEERRALHEARAGFERDRDAGLREVVAGRADLEARRRALQDRELAMQGDQDRVAKERHELALLRSCVETERDKLIAARQDAELARENAQQKVQDLDLRSRQLVAEREAMRTAQTEIERARDALQSEHHKLEEEKSKLQRERAKIEAMAKTLATSLQASLFAETPAEARKTIGLELGTDDDFLLLPSRRSKLRERQPRRKRADKSRTWSDRDEEAKDMEKKYNEEEETHSLTLQDNNNTLLLRSARGSLISAPPPAPQPQDDASKLWSSEIISELLAFSPQW